ncbi:thiamine-phosphate diphosphorylase [Vibrio sp. RE86]|uniref:thiamine-phosphate diphosphorylase n=1 Tax=Vibrio sp. RE86 TaxID=2607605 RepID=UPI001493DB8E|nr:thiamine-phosphate diphosphorylase [Vibrio sp. RE86]
MAICPEKISKEHKSREYDLRVLNRVSEGEYESRMAVWRGLPSLGNSSTEIDSYVESVFNKMQQELVDAKRELEINYNDFYSMAKEEINYIKIHTDNKHMQLFWYTAIAVTIAGTLALYI